MEQSVVFMDFATICTQTLLIVEKIKVLAEKGREEFAPCYFSTPARARNFCPFPSGLACNYVWYLKYTKNATSSHQNCHVSGILHSSSGLRWRPPPPPSSLLFFHSWTLCTVTVVLHVTLPVDVCCSENDVCRHCSKRWSPTATSWQLSQWLACRYSVNQCSLFVTNFVATRH